MNALLLPILWLLPAAADGKVAPRIPIGKDTTYVTGPVDANGFIDYEIAINERFSKGIKPETNANALLFKALGPKPEGSLLPPDFYKHLGIEQPAEKGDYFIGLHGYMRDHLKLNQDEFEMMYDQQSRAMNRPWKAEDLPHVFAWLTLNEKPLAVVLAATRRPHYFNPLVSTKTNGKSNGLINALLPNVQKCRELASALCARAMLRTTEGKYDEAWQDLMACHRLGRLVARGATLIESLVGIAIDAIASNATLAYLEKANLTSAQILKHMKDLQALPSFPSMADKISEGERFFYLDSIQLICRSGPKALAGLGIGAIPKDDEARARLVLENLDWETVLRNGNKWYDRLGESLRSKERGDREKQIDRIEAELKLLKKNVDDPDNLLPRILQGKEPLDKALSNKISDILIGLLVPAVKKVQAASDRSEQIHRNVQVAFALGAYHRENKRYPAKLAELAPLYLPAIPDDIFSGKALKYRSAANGYLLYSVGVNGKDEEGRWYDDDPAGDDPRVIMPLPDWKPRR